MRDVTDELLRAWPLPAPGEGKESRGRLAVVGGTVSTLGAIVLAGEAGLRVGAGKLQLLTASRALVLPEAMVLAVRVLESGELDPGSLPLDLLESADCVLVGPGCSSPEDAGALARAVLSVDVPVVVDGLATSVTSMEWPERTAPVVLTMNTDELEHAAGGPLSSEAEVVTAALELAGRTGAVVAPGGAVSWTASPTGAVWRDGCGGPGLGVSGSGDVRAGVTAGLLARGAAPDQAAVWGSRLHALAGARQAAPLGYLARELLPVLPGLLYELG